LSEFEKPTGISIKKKLIGIMHVSSTYLNLKKNESEILGVEQQPFFLFQSSKLYPIK